MVNKSEQVFATLFVLVVVIAVAIFCYFGYTLNANSTPQPTATPKPVVIINDQAVTVDETNFSIACDTAKELGIVYFVVTKEEGWGKSSVKFAYSPSGILTGKDYERLCGAAK